MCRYFYNLIDPFTTGPTNWVTPRDLWGFFKTHMHPFRKWIFFTSFLAILTAIIEISLVWGISWLVDNLTTDPAVFFDNHAVALALLTFGVLFLRPIVQMLHALLLQITIMPNFETQVRWRAHQHVLKQSISWFESDFAGRIANRMMQAPSAAGGALFQVLDVLGYAFAYAIGAIIILAQADVALAMPMIIWTALYLAFMLWVIGRVKPASQATSDSRSALTGKLVDGYTNIHSVKLFAHHDRELAYGRDAIETNREKFYEEMRVYTQMDIGIMTLNALLIVGVVGYAIFLWSNGSASVGVVAAATAMTLRINSMSHWIMWATSNFFQQLGIVEEGLETIAAPQSLCDKRGAVPFEIDKGAIEICDVTHRYGAETGGLEHVSLRIAPGEKVGLVGRSGAGKSTLVKLLLRFYDAEGGRILIDGQDVRDVQQETLRRHLGMVPQESALLHRSVRENILYGRPEADAAAIITAAKQAQAHEFIIGLRDSEGRTGYDAHVGERGVKLSGGQRQRIALARVILKNAPILLLDEATSALDSEAEASIQDTLYDMMTGKTVLAVAHRLSTIAQMDRIIVMDEGRIVEEGSHNALLARDGIYAQLWRRQSGGFINAEACA